MSKSSKSPPPWKRKAPNASKPKALSPAQKRAAKARAEAAGRRYPNLIDNMWAARQSELQLPKPGSE